MDDRASLLDSALRLSYFTIAWNGIVGVAALAVALATGSLAMAGFALNALLDSSASVVLVWRFRRERRDPIAAERLERHAQAVIGVAMLSIAAYVGVQATRAARRRVARDDNGLRGRSRRGVPRRVADPWPPEARGRGGTRRARQCAGMRFSRSQRQHSRQSRSRALVANSVLGWWWADPLAALVIAAALATEGVRVLVRHRFG